MTPRTVALFLPNWVGDVVMATPAVRAARAHWPDARLVAVCRPYVADALGGNPWFDETVLFDHAGPRHRRLWAVAAKLRGLRADTAVLFPNSFRPALVARLGGCNTVAGFARYGRDALLTHRLYPARDGRGRVRVLPAVDEYNRVVTRLGVPDPGRRLELQTTPADEAAADGVWNRLGLRRYRAVVGLNGGGAFGGAKHWPHFADLARRLAGRGVGVLVLNGPAERAVAADIVTAGGPGVHGLGDTPLSLGLTKACVRRLGLLATTDSGPRHFAAAFGVPVVTLFGPTHVAWTETHFEKSVHLQHRLPCGPCQQRECPLGHHRCMSDLHPADVAAAAEHLLRPAAEARRAA